MFICLTFSTIVNAVPPANKGYKLLFDESFVGDTLNTNNWYYRIGPRTGTGIDGLNLKENVFVKDGTLHITAKYEMISGAYENTGGGIITKNDFGYGYYECLSKPFMLGRGVHSAFWQAGSLVPNNNIFEIDSYEIDSKSWMACNNLYYKICPTAYTEYPWPHRANIPFKFNTDGWFLDAYERTPEGVIFYDNGEVVARAEWDELNAAQMVWLTSLNGVGTVETAKLPGESLFKYFRFYAKDYPGYNILPNGNFECNQDRITASNPVSWVVTGTADAVTIVKGNASRDNYKLRISKTAAYQTTLSQRLTYIMNGDYTLTAMVRSSGGQTEAKLKAKDFGGAEVFANITANSSWTKITIPHVEVVNNKINIDITTTGAAGQWLEIDDINLMKPVLQGQVAPTPLPFQTLSEPLWKLAEKEAVKFMGDDKFYFFDRNVGYGDAISVSFTITADMKANMTPIARIPKTGTSGWAVQLNEDGSLIFRIGSVASHTDVLASNVYTVGQPVNVCCVYNSGTAFIFINGSLVSKVTGITQFTKDGTAAGRLGAVGSAYSAVGEVVLPDSTIVNTNTTMKNFKGSIQHLRVYNIAILGDPNTEYIKNGGFETTTAGQINWEMTRDLLNYSAFTWLNTDPAEKLNSMRVVSQNSANLFGASLSQKIAVSEGRYQLKFKARATNTVAPNNKFAFKFTDYNSGKSIMLNDSAPRIVLPTSVWQSYNYMVDLNENFSAKLNFGYANAGNFDMDSISLVRIGNVISGTSKVFQNDANVKVVNSKIMVSSTTAQHLEVFSFSGLLLVSKHIPAGESSYQLKQNGVFIIRLWNENTLLTKKLIVG
jgi:beta-glucanase (GH16 family)